MSLETIPQRDQFYVRYGILKQCQQVLSRSHVIRIIFLDLFSIQRLFSTLNSFVFAGSVIVHSSLQATDGAEESDAAGSQSYLGLQQFVRCGGSNDYTI